MNAATIFHYSKSIKRTLATNCKIGILSYETNSAIYHVILKYGFIH